MKCSNDALAQKNIFVILGFARSGTSVITRALKTIGVDLGDNMVPMSKWNPTGFFEDEEIIFTIHSEVYATLGQKVRGITIIDLNKQTGEHLAKIRESAAQLLKKRFATTSHWGFKDPSTAKIIPFWQSVFAQLSLSEHYIIALRNPLASARSFSTLTKTDLETGLLLWLTHLIPAIDETVGKQRIIVSYENMLENPQIELERMQRGLNITTTVSSEEIKCYTNTFLNHSLHHNHHNQDDLKKHSASNVAPLCIDVYELLLQVANDKLSFTDDVFVQCWQEIKHNFETLYPIYCYIDQILQKNQQLRKKLKHIEKSIVWQVTQPIRWADDQLRSARVKKRKKKRLQTAYE